MGKLFCYFFMIMFIALLNISQARVLNLAGDDNFRPFIFKEMKNLKGIDIDTLHEAGKRLNVNLKIKLYPFKRVLKMIKYGKCDAGFPLRWSTATSIP